MNPRQVALVVGCLAVAVGATTGLASQLGLTTQQVALLGVVSAVLGFLQTQLPTAGVTDRRRSPRPPGPMHE